MLDCKNRFNFAGLAKHRIAIQTQTETTDSYGGRSLAWSNTYNVWAYITPVSVFENIKSQALNSEVTHKAIIRYNENLANTAVTAKYRISFDDRIYSIEGIENLSSDLKAYGYDYQRLSIRDNGSEYA
jgi:SPP1 family predicted phage head-tail adaptor